MSKWNLNVSKDFSKIDKDFVVFRPIPGSSQELCISAPSDQLMHAGSRGCGKTAGQLMAFRANVGKGYGPAHIGVIIDTEHKALDGIITQGEKLFGAKPGGECEFLYNKADYYWRWKTRERLLLRLGKTLSQAQTFRGHEYSYIAFNELTKQPTPDVYDDFCGVQRTGYAGPLGRLKTRIYTTTNPWGVGRNWVYDRFVKPNYDHENKVDRFGIPIIRNQRVPIDDPDKGVQIITVPKSILTIAGSMIENPYFTPQDRANLIMGLESDYGKMRAYLYGDWHALAGLGALDDIFDFDIHSIPNFPIPKSWDLFRALDYGSSDPFAYGLFATSDGKDVAWQGETYSIPRGAIIQIGEWYGGIPDQDGNIINEGNKFTPLQIATGINEFEENYRKAHFIHPDAYVYEGPVDSSVWHQRGHDVPPIIQIFIDNKVYFSPSDRGRGSREAGLQVVRDRLWRAKKGKPYGFYIMKRCENTLRTIPHLSREHEDIEKNQEDHCYDMVRYALMDRQRSVPPQIEVS